MAENDDLKKRNTRLAEENGDDESGTSSSTGGQTGTIAFTDFLSSAEHIRDDLLPPEEKRRLLAVHEDVHELRVKKQKDLLQARKDVKEGKIKVTDYRQGYGQANSLHSQYKMNPILAQAAQFSGSMDPQVNVDPTQFIAETNDEKRDELQYQYQLQNQLQNRPEAAPRFNPKPHFNR